MTICILVFLHVLPPIPFNSLLRSLSPWLHYVFIHKFPFENNHAALSPLVVWSNYPYFWHENSLLWNTSPRWSTSSASQGGGGRDIKLDTSRIFLTSFTRPESKMKLRKMKKDLADREDDRHRERVVKGNWPMAKEGGGLVKNWQGFCETPWWKTMSLGLSVWRII